MSWQALLVAVGVPGAIGAYMLLIWIFSPVVDAMRLSAKRDAPQELEYDDPSSGTKKQFKSIATDKPSVALSVIVPAYNEEERITVMLRSAVEYLDERKASDSAFTYEIIVVDDCSRDKTVEIVNGLIKEHSTERIKLLRLAKNHGKGGAIRKGVMRASGARVLFADADGATEIRDLAKLELAMDEECQKGKEGVIVCGSRAHLEDQAIAKRSPIRNFLMHGFHLVVSTLCVRDVRDTQCGFKLFDRAAARVVFTPMHIERWAFDVELLYVASVLKLAVREVAVEWREIPGSKLNVVIASLTMFREIVLIRLCYTLGIWKIADGRFRLEAPAKQ